MTSLADFIVIEVKGLVKVLFHIDSLGVAPAVSPIGPQLGKGETGKSGNPPPPLHYRGELQADWQV
jgi:hypothetical protein